MGENINVKVTARAYDKHHAKTALSQFDNDLHFVTKEQLDAAVHEVKQWVIDLIIQSQGSVPQGGDLNAEDVLFRALSKLNKVVLGGDIADRSDEELRAFYSAGNITDRTEADG